MPRNFQVFDALDFLAELTQHIPDKGEHLARGHRPKVGRGWYSHRLRAGSGSFSCRTPTNDSRNNDNGKKRCLTPSARAQTDNSSGNDNPPHIDRELLEGAKSDATRRRQARSWAALIQRVSEVDPLRCAKCGGQMQVVSFIEARQEEVIRRILQHCGLWQGPPRQLPQPRPPPARQRPSPPRDVQLVLDVEFAAEPPITGVSRAGRHLVPDPEYLTDRHSQTGTGQQVVPYD